MSASFGGSSALPKEPGEVTYVRMPDPCPHVTRLDVIRVRIGGTISQLDELLDHVDACRLAAGKDVW